MNKAEMAKHILASEGDTRFALVEIAAATNHLGFAGIIVHSTVDDDDYAKAAIRYADAYFSLYPKAQDSDR